VLVRSPKQVQQLRQLQTCSSPNCAPSDVPSACKIAANDLAGAEVCTGVELAPAADETRERWASSAGFGILVRTRRSAAKKTSFRRAAVLPLAASRT
jgi:hypothetical protein